MPFTVEGWTPPKKAGESSKQGPQNRPKPQGEGESKESYEKRVANWNKSYQARGGVKIAEMNQAQLNKFAASGGQKRADMIGSRISQFQANQNKPPVEPPKGGGDPNPGSGGYENDTTSTGIQDPNAPPREGGPGERGGGPNIGRGDSSLMSGSSGTDRSNIMGGASSGLSSMPPRKRRRQRRRQAQAATASASRY